MTLALDPRLCAAHVAVPQITAINPVSGTEEGGTSVVVTLSAAIAAACLDAAVGGVAATITARAGNQVTFTTPAGTVGAQDVELDFGTFVMTAFDAFTYTESGGEGTTLFESNYTNGTGRGQTAYTDGGIWPWPISGYHATEGSQIRAAADVGFPGAGGVLELVGTTTPAGGFPRPAVDGFGDLPLGVAQNVRFTIELTQTLTGDPSQHPIHDIPDATTGGISTASWPFFTTYVDLTEWWLHWRYTNNGGGPAGFAISEWGVRVPRQPLQVEYQVVRTGANTFRAHGWVDDIDGTPMFDDEDITNDEVNGGGEPESLAEGREFNFNATYGPGSFNGMIWGVEGITGAGAGALYGRMSNLKVVRGLAEGERIGPYLGA